MPTPLRLRHPWLLPVIGALALIAVIAGVILFDNARTDDAQADDNPTAEQQAEPDIPTNLEPSDVAHRDPADRAAIGSVDAPVTVVTYSDYLCSYCAEWAETNQPTVMEYVENGDVRFEMRDVAVLGEPSLRGSLAAQAAGKQDAFWEFHDALLADGAAATEAELTEDALADLAADLGLDVEAFVADMTDPEAIDPIFAHQEEADAVGVESVPTIIIGDEIVIGAQPVDELEDIIDTAITEASQD